MPMKRTKNTICPYCGSIAIFRDGKYVYGDSSKGEKLYVCSNYPACDSYVGVHKGTSLPLGTLANSELRNKRIRAHKLFDSIWKNKLMSKKEAYRWIEISILPCCVICYVHKLTISKAVRLIIKPCVK